MQCENKKTRSWNTTRKKSKGRSVSRVKNRLLGLELHLWLQDSQELELGRELQMLQQEAHRRESESIGYRKIEPNTNDMFLNVIQDYNIFMMSF